MALSDGIIKDVKHTRWNYIYLCLFNNWNKLVNMRDRVTKCIFNRDYLQCNVNNWSSDMNNLCEQLELDIMNLNSLFHPYW